MFTIKISNIAYTTRCTSLMYLCTYRSTQKCCSIYNMDSGQQGVWI